MSSAAAVANEFLGLGWSEPDVPSITQMKLQKLLFYAHAWYLAIKGEPLFEDDFEAWPWGPVVRDVYGQTAKYGRSPITATIKRLQKTPNGEFGFVAPVLDDQERRDLVKAVWQTHKGFTGVQLSNSTHAPGEPWTIIRDTYGSLDGKPTIPNEIIETVFKAKLRGIADAG